MQPEDPKYPPDPPQPGSTPAPAASAEPGNGGGQAGEGAPADGNGGNGNGGSGMRRMQRRGRRRGRAGKGDKRGPKPDQPAFVPVMDDSQPPMDFQAGDAQPQSQPQQQREKKRPRGPAGMRGPGARGQRGQRPPREPREPRPPQGDDNIGNAVPGSANPGNASPGNGESGGSEDHKLQKLLAEAGLGSRRDMEEAITAGRVSVNGKIATLGQRITRRDVVRCDGKQVRIKTGREPAEVIIYHKPVGEIVTHDDPEGRPSVFEKLPPPKAGKWIAVGRLDFNTEGLLILTTSGELANRLMHPRYEVEREYSVRVIGELTDDQMDQLLDGVELDDGPARFMKLDEGHFSDETPGINRWYEVMIREGRNREVRRMFEAVGVTVSRLIRTRFGPIALPRTLRRGQMRPLTPLEVKDLTKGAPSGKTDGADSGLPAGLLPGLGGPPGEPAGDAPRGRGARKTRGNKGKRGAAQGPNGNVANGNVAGGNRAPGRGARAGKPGRGNGINAGPATGRKAKGKVRGKRGGIDPASMTLDGRRVVKRRREEEPPPKPVHTPVIIHRRSKLKLMPDGGGGSSDEGGAG